MLPVDGLYLRRVVLVALCSALAAGTLGSPVLGPEPIRCAPCTPERLSQCPAVASGCAEVLREPGCGCCLACALPAGELCGIYTAPCGSGLRCTPRPGDPRPLHSLTRGQAVCTANAEPLSTPEPQQTQGRPPQVFSAKILLNSLASTLEHLHSFFAPCRSGRAGAGDGEHSHRLGPQLQPLPPRSQQALRPTGVRGHAGEHEGQSDRDPEEAGGAGEGSRSAADRPCAGSK